MARVICTLPNASERINGVQFTSDKGQMVSEEMPDEHAAHFAKIPGYRVHHAPKHAEPAREAEKADIKDAKGASAPTKKD